MPRGGYREKAGRPKGALTKKVLAPKVKPHKEAEKIMEAVLKREDTPLTVMLEAMEHFVAEARRLATLPNGIEVRAIPAEKDGGTPTVEVLRVSSMYVAASEMAKKAAPYVHPSLQSTEVRVNRAFEDAVLTMEEAARRAAETDDKPAEVSASVH